MKIEHVAFNVADALSMGRWYVEHLGFTVKRRIVEPPWVHFLADDSGTVMFEVYSTPAAPVPDYQAMDRDPWGFAVQLVQRGTPMI